jgi:hypothetical protein
MCNACPTESKCNACPVDSNIFSFYHISSTQTHVHPHRSPEKKKGILILLIRKFPDATVRKLHVPFQTVRGHASCTCWRQLDNTGAVLEIFPAKSVAPLAGQTGESASPARNPTKLLHSYPYKTIMFHKLCDSNYAAKHNSVNWYRHGVNAEEIHPTLVCLISEASVFQRTREFSE